MSAAPLRLPVALCAGLTIATAAALAQEEGATAARAPEVTFPFRPYAFVVGALSTSVLLVPDSLCPDPGDICPFGGGGGIFGGGGYRYHRTREWLVGYDLSVRNARNLFASATLQQLRIEHRWIFFATPAHNFEAFVGVSGAAALFGELLGVRTVGVALGLSAGATYNLGAFFRLGLALRLDAIRFLVPFVAGDGVLRADGGVASASAHFMVFGEFLGH